MRDKRGNYLSVVSETSPSQPHHGSSQPPLTTISDGSFFWPKSLSLSLNLTSLPRSNPKSINFSLYTQFSPNPNPCSLSDLGLKRAHRCVCVWGFWFPTVSCYFFFFFWLMGLSWVCWQWWSTRLRETHRASVDVERVVEAQSWLREKERGERV